MSFIYSIIPYYGAFPNYFQLYLDSVEINSDILKIMLITDIDVSNYKIPSNVIIINLSISQVRERIVLYFKKYHNINVNSNDVLMTPYKFCDFRVVFKFLFLDIFEKIGINDNDYWGWSDCDLIYGNILKNIPEIRKYEFIGWHGHFTAIKNNNLYDTYLLDIDNLKNDLLKKRGVAIDENGYRTLLRKYAFGGKIPYLSLTKHSPLTNAFYILDIYPPPGVVHANYDQGIFDATIHYNPKESNREEIKYIMFDKKNKNLIASFKNLDDKQFIYAHLQKRKMEVKFSNYNDEFYFNKDSFYLQNL